MMDSQGSDCKYREQGAGLYVDVENLQSHAQAFITAIIEDWHPEIPKPRYLYLYVRADQMQLWELWATSKFRDARVVVKGVQHFSKKESKNSADISMALDAMSDFLLKRVGHIVVVSDDSDFIALFSKIQAEYSRLGENNGIVPFLWILTDREGTRSATIRDYFPNDFIHVVEHPNRQIKAQSNSLTDNLIDGAADSPKQNESKGNPLEELAEVIIKEMPLGPFKSTDCQKIIKKTWPNHQLAKVDGANFGIQFGKTLLPVLKDLGVAEPNPNKKPKRFEMTDKAKNAVL